MPARKVKLGNDVYQVKITLAGSRPAIWRRVLLPGDLTLAELHDVIQIALGWTDSHLHNFQIGRKTFSVCDDSDMDDPECVDESGVRFGDVLGKVGAKGEYTYDFGDGWLHSLLVEKVLDLDAAASYPVCIAGKRCGPPEDCGGVGGYYRLLKVIGNPDHAEYEEMLEWLGEGFEPEAFSLQEVNEALAGLRQKRAKAGGPN